MPRGLPGIGQNISSEVPPSRILIFCDRLTLRNQRVFLLARISQFTTAIDGGNTAARQSPKRLRGIFVLSVAWPLASPKAFKVA